MEVPTENLESIVKYSNSLYRPLLLQVYDVMRLLITYVYFMHSIIYMYLILFRLPTANEDNDFTSNIVIYADCHASNRGLFLGLIVMVSVTGMLIIGFVFSSVGE